MRSECCRGQRVTRATLPFTVITVLLHIGGIESNPDPDFQFKDEVSSKIDILIQVSNEIKSELPELRSVKEDIGNVKTSCDRLNEVCNDE